MKKISSKGIYAGIVFVLVLVSVFVIFKVMKGKDSVKPVSKVVNTTEKAATVQEKESENDVSGTDIVVEAEAGAFTGVDTDTDSTASGGKFVKGFDSSGDTLKLTADLEARGTYAIIVRYKTFGGDKPNTLLLNNNKLKDYTFKDTTEWKDAVIGQFDLYKGENTFSIASSWGWIAVDNVRFVGGPGGTVKSVTLSADTEESKASDVPVTLTAVADNCSEYRFFVKRAGGDWQVLNEYSKNLSYAWVPEMVGDYEVKVYARGIGHAVEKEAESTMKYTALASYINKPLINQMFSDNMILQRDVDNSIYGWTKPDTKIIVTIDGKSFSAVGGSNGKWTVNIGAFKAGGPYTISVSDGTETKDITNILFGDVWLCSGQSNMEFTLSNTADAANVIKNSQNNNIRYFTVPRKTSAVPVSIMENAGGWKICTPESTPSLSAVAYFYAQRLNKELNVPIGIIFSSVGGTKAESWTSYESLKTFPDFAQSAEAVKSGAVEIAIDSSPIALYNGMIAPVAGYKLKGVLWYQGESNWGEIRYNKLLTNLIADWRRTFDNSELPFIVIQISAYGTLQSPTNPAQRNTGLPEVREAQLNTMLKENNVGLVVTADLGDPSNIHPTNKQDVGMRSALCALGKFYRKNIVYSGPIYKSMVKQGTEIKITFDSVGSGLIAAIKDGLEPVKEDKSGSLSGFAIAGADNIFYWANAAIQGDSVIVSSNKVADPTAVRFGWNDSPIINLYNKEGLLASPFRTDEKYQLIVINGLGEGIYNKDETVSIKAFPAAKGMKFDKWIGDVENIEDVSNPKTNIKLSGSQYITVEPTYITESSK